MPPHLKNGEKVWIDDEMKDQLKREADFIGLLRDFGATEIKSGSDTNQFYFKCLFPDCDSKGKDYSMGVNTEKQAFNCFHCGRQGDIYKFIMNFKGINFYQAKKLLLERSQRSQIKNNLSQSGDSSAQTVTPLKQSNQLKDKKENFKIKYKPFRRRLTGLRIENIPILEEKGITPATAEKFNVGYCSQGFMKGRIVVPIHDSIISGTDDKNILAYAGYSVTKRQKEYGDWKFPDDFPKGKQLFNLNRVIKETKEAREILEKHGIIIVESFWNVLKLYQAGIKNVVALMGTALTQDQEKLLLDQTDKIKLWLDNDEAGKKGVQNILRTPEQKGHNGLIYKAHIKIISPENNFLTEKVANRKKPYQFNEDEIRKILR